MQQSGRGTAMLVALCMPLIERTHVWHVGKPNHYIYYSLCTRQAFIDLPAELSKMVYAYFIDLAHFLLIVCFQSLHSWAHN